MKSHLLMLTSAAAAALTTGCAGGLAHGAKKADPIFADTDQIGKVDIAWNIHKYAKAEREAVEGAQPSAEPRTGITSAAFTRIVDARPSTTFKKEYPTDLRFGDPKFSLEDALFEFAISVPADQKELYRNEIVSLAIVSADKSCGDYLNTLRVDQSNTRTTFGLLNQGVNVAGAITQHLGTSNLMSAFSGVFSNAGETIDQNIFATAGSELVAFEVAEMFDTHRVAIIDKFDLPYSKWPLGLALADVEAAAQACDLRTGLASVQQKVTSASAVDRVRTEVAEQAEQKVALVTSTATAAVTESFEQTKQEMVVAASSNNDQLLELAQRIAQTSDAAARKTLLAEFELEVNRQPAELAAKLDTVAPPSQAVVEALKTPLDAEEPDDDTNIVDPVSN